MNTLSNSFRALGEPLRLRILKFLIKASKEAYGDEIAQSLGIPAYQLSRHLKILKNAGLVKERKEGRLVYYSISKDNADLMRSVSALLSKTKEPTIINFRKTNSIKSIKARNGHNKSVIKNVNPPMIPDAKNLNPDEFDWNAGPAIPGVL